MRSIELNMFINNPRCEVYDQLAEPINMIGLQPRLTAIDILKEQKKNDGILLRPFYMVETYWLLGLPVLRTRVYTVIGLTRPGDELEIRVYRNPGIVLLHQFQIHRIEDEAERTHIVQKISYEKGAKLLEGIVFRQEIKAQRALLTNLKVRLEKQ
jgi:hypothetical protein